MMAGWYPVLKQPTLECDACKLYKQNRQPDSGHHRIDLSCYLIPPKAGIASDRSNAMHVEPNQVHRVAITQWGECVLQLLMTIKNVYH